MQPIKFQYDLIFKIGPTAFMVRCFPTKMEKMNEGSELSSEDLFKLHVKIRLLKFCDSLLCSHNSCCVQFQILLLSSVYAYIYIYTPFAFCMSMPDVWAS